MTKDDILCKHIQASMDPCIHSHSEARIQQETRTKGQKNKGQKNKGQKNKGQKNKGHDNLTSLHVGPENTDAYQLLGSRPGPGRPLMGARKMHLIWAWQPTRPNRDVTSVNAMPTQNIEARLLPRQSQCSRLFSP